MVLDGIIKLDDAVKKVGDWSFRLVRVKMNKSQLAKALGVTNAKISRLFKTDKKNVGNMRMCEFCAVESFLAQKEREYDIAQRD